MASNRLFLLPIPFFAACLLSCAGPQRLLSDAGQLVLVKDGQRVALKGKDRLFIRWRTDGKELFTQATADGRDSLVAVTIVEANEQIARIRADAWKELEDVPRSYSQAGIRVTGGSGRRGKSVVNVPLGDIEEIALCERRLTTADWAGFSRRNAMVGALGGFVFGGTAAGADAVIFQDRSHPDDPWRLRGNEALMAVAITTATGAVAYPAYRVFWPRFRQRIGTIYAIGREGWRIEIER